MAVHALPFIDVYDTSSNNHIDGWHMQAYLTDMIAKISGRRVFPGFRIGEALAYILFCLFWPAVLGSVYYFGSAFNSSDFIPLHVFVYTNLLSFIIKIVLIIPVWWLYFKKLKRKPLRLKLLLHIITGPIFGFFVVLYCRIAYDVFLRATYPRTVQLSDFYTFTVYYFFHVSLFHAYNFYADEKRQALRQQQLQALAYETEIKALKAQIEPHFLFNTLNSISASIPGSMEKTRVMISQLADTFRHALKSNEFDMIPLEEELAFIKTWLALEKQRFGKRIETLYNIDESCMGALVPPMILQPMVENAIRHGLSPKLEGGQICISCYSENSFAVITVSDTGVGFDGSLDKMMNLGVGLSNTAKRLKLLYDETLHVERLDTGLKFHFRVPLNAELL